MKHSASITSLLILLFLAACAPTTTGLPSADSDDSALVATKEGVVALVMFDQELLAVWSDDSVIPGPGAHRIPGAFDLENGLHAELDGTVTMPDGNIIHLQDGQALTMDGQIRGPFILNLEL